LSSGALVRDLLMIAIEGLVGYYLLICLLVFQFRQLCTI